MEKGNHVVHKFAKDHHFLLLQHPFSTHHDEQSKSFSNPFLFFDHKTGEWMKSPKVYIDVFCGNFISLEVPDDKIKPCSHSSESTDVSQVKMAEAAASSELLKETPHQQYTRAGDVKRYV